MATPAANVAGRGTRAARLLVAVSMTARLLELVEKLKQVT
jgi:hypothetical protein